MAIYYIRSMRMWKIDGPRVGAPFFMRTTMHSNLNSIWWDADLLHKKLYFIYMIQLNQTQTMPRHKRD